MSTEENGKSATDEATATLEDTLKTLEGYRRAQRAALYANIRGILAASLDSKDPVLGVYGMGFRQSGAATFLCGGAVPRQTLFSAIGAMTGEHTDNRIAHALGDKKGQALGDQYDPKSGKTHCVTCEDGDPTGEHALEELRKNARAWLGLLTDVALGYYGEHLPDGARGPLEELAKLALPAGEPVS